jgi:hypothetical protein
MNKILSYLCLLFFTFGISANSKGNIVDRKKNFDSKTKFLFSMQEIITSEKLNKDLQGLKEMVNEVDTTYRSGEKEKIKKTLSLGEMKLATSMKDYTTFISAETKELMEAYSSQVTNAEEKEADKKSKPTVASTTTREKSSEYYTIAKADYANATKFERDGNLQYAIQLFKRALNYTVLAFDNAKYPLPAKYANLSKTFSPANETADAPHPAGTHTSPAKETKDTKETKPAGPIKSIK